MELMDLLYALRALILFSIMKKCFILYLSLFLFYFASPCPFSCFFFYFLMFKIVVGVATLLSGYTKLPLCINPILYYKDIFYFIFLSFFVLFHLSSCPTCPYSLLVSFSAPPLVAYTSQSWRRKFCDSLTASVATPTKRYALNLYSVFRF